MKLLFFSLILFGLLVLFPSVFPDDIKAREMLESEMEKIRQEVAVYSYLDKALADRLVILLEYNRGLIKSFLEEGIRIKRKIEEEIDSVNRKFNDMVFRDGEIAAKAEYGELLKYLRYQLRTQEENNRSSSKSYWLKNSRYKRAHNDSEKYSVFFIISGDKSIGPLGAHKDIREFLLLKRDELIMDIVWEEKFKIKFTNLINNNRPKGQEV